MRLKFKPKSRITEPLYIRLKSAFIFLGVLVSGAVFCQHKTKNIVLVTMDGYRWEELFKGADSIIFAKRYTSQDSVWRVKKYWAADAKTRREKLMPFFLVDHSC